MRIPTPTLGIPTAACYREVTATRLAGLFTHSRSWWIVHTQPTETAGGLGFPKSTSARWWDLG